MTLSLAVGREARAQSERGIPYNPSTNPPLPHVMAAPALPEDHPSRWRTFFDYRDEDDGTVTDVDIDDPLKLGPWVPSEAELAEGGGM